MWSLPPERRTAALTNLIETAFYKRVPLEQRPKYLKEVNAPDATDVSNSSDSNKGKDPEKAARCEDEKEEDNGDIQSAKNRPGNMKADGESQNAKTGKSRKEKYSKRPLLAAAHAAFFWRWWTAGLLLLCSSASYFLSANFIR